MNDQHVLVDILSTLHRLEARFDDQDDRLQTIERSVSPDPDHSLRRSTSTRTWTSTRASVDQMAAEYKTSIAEIRNRFAFIDDDDSELNINQADPDKDNDGRSVSVYPELSRPQSQLQLELVPPPRNPNREKAPGMIAVRYEDIVDSPAPISSSGSSISNTQFSSSNSSGVSSATTPGYTGTVTFSDFLDNGNHSGGSRDSVSTAQNHFRASVSQHTANLRNRSQVLVRKAFDGLSAAVDMLPHRMDTVKHSATRVSQTCFKAMQRVTTCVGQKMVEQQLKRLDTSL